MKKLSRGNKTRVAAGMSTKTLLIIALAAALLAAGVFFLFRHLPPAAQAPPARALPTHPWVEVTKPKVVRAALGTIPERELATGDELADGSTITTDRSGSAVVHFPDGSVARVAPETTLTIDTATFNADSEALTVRMTLGSGRVWSKVFTPATADSRWEVQTANILATTRGTSFGVGYLEGKSEVVSSEGTVAVSARDLKTGGIVTGMEAAVTPNTFITVSNEDTKDFKERRRVLGISAAPSDVREWLAQNQETDDVLNQKLEKLREAGKEGKALREEFREVIFNEIEQGQGTPAGGAKPAGESAGKPAGAGSGGTAGSNAAQTLAVTTPQSTGGIIEGDRIVFEAIITEQNGEKRNVTDSATWQVIGHIGRIDGPGIFVAALDDTVSELGRAPGMVVATWRDEVSGENFIANSDTFEVEAKVEESTTTPAG